MSHLKNEVSFSDFEQQTYHVNANTNQKSRHLRTVHWIRNVMNSVAFVCGVLVFAFALDAKVTYNNTSVPANYLLSLWPQQFNVGPTNALISTGVIVVITSFVTAVVSWPSTVSCRCSLHIMSQAELTFLATVKGPFSTKSVHQPHCLRFWWHWYHCELGILPHHQAIRHGRYY